MNLLIDTMPTTVEIDGKEYEINTDFRTCVNIMLAFEDTELTNVEKQTVMLANLYDQMPENGKLAAERAIWFLNGGKEEQQESSVSSKTHRYYSFGKDASFIVAAFKQTHGIDLLDTEYMHWWKFMALFMDLGQETTFTNLVALRKRVKIGKATKEERAAASDMGDVFDLPDFTQLSIEEMEKEREFMNKVKLGRAKRKQESK